jgi:hypothetical protein
LGGEVNADKLQQVLPFEFSDFKTLCQITVLSIGSIAELMVVGEKT